MVACRVGIPRSNGAHFNGPGRCTRLTSHRISGRLVLEERLFCLGCGHCQCVLAADYAVMGKTILTRKEDQNDMATIRCTPLVRQQNRRTLSQQRCKRLKFGVRNAEGTLTHTQCAKTAFVPDRSNAPGGLLKVVARHKGRYAPAEGLRDFYRTN